MGQRFLMGVGSQRLLTGDQLVVGKFVVVWGRDRLTKVVCQLGRVGFLAWFIKLY